MKLKLYSILKISDEDIECIKNIYSKFSYLNKYYRLCIYDFIKVKICHLLDTEMYKYNDEEEVLKNVYSEGYIKKIKEHFHEERENKKFFFKVVGLSFGKNKLEILLKAKKHFRNNFLKYYTNPNEIFKIKIAKKNKIDKINTEEINKEARLFEEILKLYFKEGDKIKTKKIKMTKDYNNFKSIRELISYCW